MKRTINLSNLDIFTINLYLAMADECCGTIPKNKKEGLMEIAIKFEKQEDLDIFNRMESCLVHQIVEKSKGA